MLPRPPRPIRRGGAESSHTHACLETGFDARPATEQAPLSVNIGTRATGERRLCWTPRRRRSKGRKALPPQIGHTSGHAVPQDPPPTHTFAGGGFFRTTEGLSTFRQMKRKLQKPRGSNKKHIPKLKVTFQRYAKLLHNSLLTTSPPPRVAKALQTFGSTESRKNRTAPSMESPLTPPGCVLLALNTPS